MAIEKNVIVAPKANQEYLATIKYLKEEWTIREIEKFEQKFVKATSLLKTNSESFPISKKNMRKYVLDKNNVIFYRIKKDIVEIVSIWSAKQSPKKLKL